MSKNANRRSHALAAALLLISGHASAFPATARDGPTLNQQTIEEWTTAALADFLSVWHADTEAFNVKGPWTSIDFAGDAAGNLTEYQMNNDVYQSCDSQNNRANNSRVSFSGAYKDFVQDLNKAVPIPTPSQQVNDTTKQMTSACYTGGLKTARTAALQTYNDIATNPTTNASDPTFLAWAQKSYPDYKNAYTACQQATLAYYAAVDTNDGDDEGVYTAARENIEPLLDEAQSYPGINMPIQPPSGTNVGQDGGFVPYYEIPTLNSTLSAWQAGSGLSPASFNSSTASASSSSSATWGGASLGITYEGIGASASASHSSSQSSSNVSAFGFSLSFQGLALLDIEQGVWFDGYRVAHAAETPDSQHHAAQAVFNSSSYFGSKDKPGPLAVYNSQALVGFKPSWSIQFADSHASSSSSSTSGSVGLSVFGLIDLGGYFGSSKNSTHYDSSTNTLTVSDDSNNAYIIGYVQSSYYTWS